MADIATLVEDVAERQLHPARKNDVRSNELADRFRSTAESARLSDLGGPRACPRAG